ncbi:MAG: GNAT family N-acetyltransferase [Paracoccaceae bacterium]|nr:GNAT family N-acetyltransferase [Paracoccaceae bacterium]
MQTTISYAKTERDLSGVAEITRRYLEWDIGEFEKVSGISLDLKDYLSNTLDSLDDYMPPNGRLVMARDEVGSLVGLVLLKKLGKGAGEIKRLYVVPEARGQGVGHKLIGTLLQEARQIGYDRLFLDTATYMPSAHRLYRSFGFRDTDAYPGSENDEIVQKFLIFMKLEF